MNKQTKKLMSTYLVVIMVLSILFSVLLYFVVSTQLGKPLPPQRRAQQMLTSEDIPELLQRRIDQRDSDAKESLITSLVLLNASMLLGGTLISYFLARKTLEPIEQAMERQERFIADASHELRTPLTGLLTLNEVALRKKSIDDAYARELITKNIEKIKNLTDLSNHLLNMEGREKSHKTTTDIGSLIEELVNDFRSTSDKEISFEKDNQSIVVQTNAGALEQIVRIYLDNAVKHSSKKAKIKVESTVDKKNSTAVIKVTNGGKPLEKGEMKQIFERFYQSDKARTRTPNTGYGLGLSIAQSLAEKNDFRLDVTSDEKTGNTFSVHVPLK